MRRALGPIALVLAIAGYGVMRSPTDIGAAPLERAPVPTPPHRHFAKPTVRPAADAPSSQRSSRTTSAGSTATPGGAPPTGPDTSPSFGATLCKKVGLAALQNGLPAEFFARLIWQESRFDTHSVSPKGARGIAQFMPETARSRGLADPFEPSQALRESARWLKELREQFGNLGLAAAAYNSGPRRVQDWLHGRGKLPGETRDYVKIITGRSVEEWVKLRSDVGAKSFAAASVIPCNDIVTVLAHDPSPTLEQGAATNPKIDIVTVLAHDPSPSEQAAATSPKTETVTVSPEQAAATNSKNDIVTVEAHDGYPLAEHGAATPPGNDDLAVPQGAPQSARAASASGPWGLQLVGNWSEERALIEYRSLQQKFPDILGDRPPLLLRGTMPGRGSASWYRIRVAESTRERAAELCARLARAGGTCLVLKN